jgi:hypothetical protein
MIKPLVTKNTFFTTTLIEAENTITRIKEEVGEESVLKHTITRKEKKELEYFIVEVTIENTNLKYLLAGLID